ncbi:MAG: DnaJ domain-containing protein [Gammaproteobacteria bacterium]|nr:DnaJ domain-containing protein [Gammaproteobacteria bacterium]
MLFRLVIAFIIAVAVFAVLRITLRGKSLSVRQFMQIYFLVLIGLMLLYLGLTGKLHPLFVVLGVALPFLMRLLTWIPRVLQLFSIFRFLRGFVPTGSPQSSPSGQGRISDINTRFLHMVLFHDSGMMDGEVLAGKFSGSKLSMMELEELLELLEECRVDADSLHVMEAFLDREHKDWRDHVDSPRESPPFADDSMSERQAYEILGLNTDASRDDVIQAHRRLMQKLHPDHGGSTYLAARINEAKSMLLNKLGKE